MKKFPLMFLFLLASCSTSKLIKNNSTSSDSSRVPAGEISVSILTPDDIERMRSDAMSGVRHLRIQSDEFYVTSFRLVYQLDNQSKISKECPLNIWNYSSPDQSKTVKISNKFSNKKCSYNLKQSYLFIIPKKLIKGEVTDYRPSFNDAAIELKIQDMEEKQIEFQCKTNKQFFEIITDCGFDGKSLTLGDNSEINISLQAEP